MHMLREDFNHEKFYKSYQSMYLDDRIMKNKTAEYAAIALYDALLNKIGLSDNSISKGDVRWINKNEKVFCTFTEEDAKNELSMSPRQYKSRKPFLKEAGLIDYEEQDVKAIGNASRITVTPWHVWIRKNGLINKGEWIILPSSPNYYNPVEIVKVLPSITTVEYVGHESINTEPTKEEIAEHEELLKKGNSHGLEFNKAGLYEDLIEIVENHLGESKKFKLAPIEKLPQMRKIIAEMDSVLALVITNNKL